MRGSSRRRLQRIVDVALSLVVALLVAGNVSDAVGLFGLGLLLGAVQGMALWWRRSKPVLVMAIALAGGLVVQLVAPEGVFPYAGLVAIFALAATRPPRVSLPGSPACSPSRP